MWQHAGNMLFSCWLALLLLFGATPKEFIHQFAGHQDTQECFTHQEGLRFEKLHHHCDFLTFQLLPFAAAAVLKWRPQPQPPVYIVWQVARVAPVFPVPFSGKPMRGPPAA